MRKIILVMIILSTTALSGHQLLGARTFILFGGYKWMLVAGNDSKIENPKGETIVGPGGIELWRSNHIIYGRIMGSAGGVKYFFIDTLSGEVTTGDDRHGFAFSKQYEPNHSASMMVTLFDVIPGAQFPQSEAREHLGPQK